MGIVFWILLFAWEFIVQKKWEEKLATMFPWRLIKNRVYMFGLATTLLMGFPYFVVIYSLPLRFQVVNGKSPLTAGLGLLPMLGSTAIASFLGGMLNGTKNRVFLTLLAGSGLSVIGTSSLSTLANTEYVEAKTYGFLVFVGLGFGLTVSTVSMLVSTPTKLFLTMLSLTNDTKVKLRIIHPRPRGRTRNHIASTHSRRQHRNSSQYRYSQFSTTNTINWHRESGTTCFVRVFGKDNDICATPRSETSLLRFF